MKNTIYLLAFFFITSCASSYKVVNVQYQRKIADVSLSKNPIYSISLPKGFKTTTLVGGHNELEKRYIFLDSATIYISDFFISDLNYKNIESLGNGIVSKRMINYELKSKVAKQIGKEYIPETIILEGESSNGLYWKDVRVGYLSIGYVNITKERKNDFDKVLTSFNIK